MRHNLPFAVPEEILDKLMEGAARFWKEEYFDLWSPERDIPLGLHAIDAWWSRTHCLLPLLDLLNEEAERTDNPMESSLYGVTMVLKDALEDLFGLLEFAITSLPHDPVVKRLGQNADLNDATESKNGEGERSPGAQTSGTEEEEIQNGLPN